MSAAAIVRSALLANVVHAAAGGLARGELEQFVEKAVWLYLEQLAELVIATGEPVKLPGFGTFYRATWSPTALGMLRGGPKHRLAFKASRKRRKVPA